MGSICALSQGSLLPTRWVGHTNFHTNSHSNGHTDAYTNGHADTHSNGHTNSHTNGHTDTGPPRLQLQLRL